MTDKLQAKFNKRMNKRNKAAKKRNKKFGFVIISRDKS